VIELDTVDGAFGERALESPGGFIWWYVDIADRKGNGAVAIWSFGLPFLPGYAAAARAGSAPPARERPSLNVAVYRDWELDCYLLQEYEPAEIAGDPTGPEWSFGDSDVRVADSERGRSVVAELDCAVPGTDERLTGTVEAEGVAPRRESPGRFSPGASGAETGHRWLPRAVPATGRVDLELGATQTYEFEGRAYHDANSGTTPLHELGIRRWHWGRAPVGDREIVYYALWGDREDDGAEPAEEFALILRDDGTMRRVDSVDLELREPRRNMGGLRWWRSASLASRDPKLPDLQVHHRSAVDSGPFYMRYMTEVEAEGESSVGMAELIRPDRIDLARHRPFVNMRVHRTSDSNSMWLPLFSGPKRGRLGRWFRHNFGGGRG